MNRNVGALTLSVVYFHWFWDSNFLSSGVRWNLEFMWACFTLKFSYSATRIFSSRIYRLAYSVICPTLWIVNDTSMEFSQHNLYLSIWVRHARDKATGLSRVQPAQDGVCRGPLRNEIIYHSLHIQAEECRSAYTYAPPPMLIEPKNEKYSKKVK